MRLTVIGCAGSYPGPDSPASCYLVEHDGFAVLLDLGSGSLGPLQRYASLDAIDAIVLSHLHADHCLDLCSYYVYRRYHPAGPRPRIPVFGPRSTASRMARAYDLPEGPGMSDRFNFVDIADTMRLGPMTITSARVNHPIEAFGFRIEAGGRTLAYSGDTGECESLVSLARDADLALFEASFLDTDTTPDVHLTARQAGEHATRAGARHLMLTHLVPWNDPATTRAQAEQAYAGPLTLAESGMVFDLS